jgi:hypothetical protein
MRRALSMVEWKSALAALGLFESYSKMSTRALNFQMIEWTFCVADRSAFQRPFGLKNWLIPTQMDMATDVMNTMMSAAV